MRKLHLILTFLPFLITAQIDQNILVIGRNIGTHTFHDGEQTRIFGFTQTLSADTKIPGPTLICNSGDSVKIDFYNVSQGDGHTIHLHGMDVNQQNDGVPEFSFEVMHTEHGYYYFKAPHPGTYLYHCHVGSAIHLQAGMYGLIIVRPTDGSTNLNWDGGENYDREFSLLASEIDTVWHNDTILDHVHMSGMPMYVPDNYIPQYFMVNGMSGNQLSDPSGHLYCLANDKVYMRMANIGYYGLRYIFPSSLAARTVASDGRPLPSEMISDTVEILPGERFETFLQTGTDQLYPFTVEHFNLNTQVVESTQTMYLHISALSVEEESQIIAYPNPTDGIFYLTDGVELEFELLESSGKLLESGNGSFVDLSEYSPGVYYVRIQNRILLVVRN